MSEANVELVARTIPSADLNFAEVARSDEMYAAYIEVFASGFHADVTFVNHGSPAPETTCVGLAGVRSLFRDWYRPWKTYRTEVERAVDCGAQVLIGRATSECFGEPRRRARLLWAVSTPSVTGGLPDGTSTLTATMPSTPWGYGSRRCRRIWTSCARSVRPGEAETSRRPSGRTPTSTS